MTEFYDSLETRDPAECEKALLTVLPAQIAHAQECAPGFSRIPAGIDARSVTSRAALARLPVTRKSDLGELQKQEPPLGGLNATPLAKLAKIFVSPGPIMGRADQTTKVRGMFVTPKQVAEILRRHPEVAKARLAVGGEPGKDSMTLKCEIDNDSHDNGSHDHDRLRQALVASIRDVTKLRGDVECVPAGSLPNDGKVIDDTRTYA